MPLGIRHGATIEPYIDEVGFPLHRLSGIGNQGYAVHNILVKVNLFVVRFGHIAYDKIFENILVHDPGLDRLCHFGFQFGHGADNAFFLPVFGTPDR